MQQLYQPADREMAQIAGMVEICLRLPSLSSSAW